MDIELEANERIDDLEFKNLKIIQNKDGFCFGIDSVLLSDFAKNIKKDSMVLDLGTGTGIIPILLCGKTKLKKVTGIELQEEVAKMAKKSIKLNNLEDKFNVINENILNLNKIYENQTFDVIVSNPPYKKKDTGITNENEKKIISRHEISASLEDFIKISKDLLKDKGEFYMVHRPFRLAEIMTLMCQYKLEPKRMKLVYPMIDKEPNMVLIEGQLGGKSRITVEKPLIVYEKPGVYTPEIYEIYGY